MKLDDLEIMDFNDGDSGETLDQDETEVLAKKEPAFLLKEIISWVLTFAVAFVCIFLLKNYVIINANVPTGSMENTIMAGDNLLGNRLAYVKDTPERGDIIFFYYPDDETQKFVKRVIGLPGETVRIEDGKVYIDDSEVPLEEPYLKEMWTRGTGPFEFVVPEGYYFVLGDNRNTSRDSRYWANPYVAQEKIIGKAILVYFPFEHMDLLE